MEKLLLLSGKLLDITISRLCQELIENHDDFKQTVLVGMQPRGKFFADKIQQRLQSIANIHVPIGYLDVTFYRDDFRRRESPLKANATYMPFVIEDKKVVLIDDVLYTGRTIRSALSALAEFGRPSNIELLILIDRLYSRDLPIQPDYVGRSVNTIQSQRVQVEWAAQGATEDTIYLCSQ
jgi:pyrimidine operon attenuation protein/uracil phosphoribosyltransferase